MSNATYVNSAKKPCFRFIFPDADSAKLFFAIAIEDHDTTRVQHPYSHTKQVSQDHTQVFVTGSGSLVYDLNLRTRLIDAADELGGHMLND